MTDDDLRGVDDGPDWDATRADMFREMAKDLRGIADDVNEESANELREIATALEMFADYHEHGGIES